MGPYFYELIAESEEDREEVVLMAATTTDALEVFDNHFLELHVTRAKMPESMRLFLHEGGEELAHYAMHFEALR